MQIKVFFLNCLNIMKCQLQELEMRKTHTWSWVASVAPLLPCTCDILGNVSVSPSSRRRPRMGSPACLWSSRGALPIHLGGNTYARHVYFQKPGILSTLGLRQQQNLRALSRTIKVILQEDRHRRVTEVGSAVDSLLASDLPLIRESWIRIRG